MALLPNVESAEAMETTTRIARPSFWPGRFNRDMNFVWAKCRTVNGALTEVGAPVNKTDYTTRKLKVFYEEGLIKLAESQPEKLSNPVQPSEVQFEPSKEVNWMEVARIQPEEVKPTKPVFSLPNGIKKVKR